MCVPNNPSALGVETRRSLGLPGGHPSTRSVREPQKNKEKNEEQNVHRPLLAEPEAGSRAGGLGVRVGFKPNAVDAR